MNLTTSLEMPCGLLMQDGTEVPCPQQGEGLLPRRVAGERLVRRQGGDVGVHEPEQEEVDRVASDVDRTLARRTVPARQLERRARRIYFKNDGAF